MIAIGSLKRLPSGNAGGSISRGTGLSPERRSSIDAIMLSRRYITVAEKRVGERRVAWARVRHLMFFPWCFIFLRLCIASILFWPVDYKVTVTLQIKWKVKCFPSRKRCDELYSI